MHKVEIEWAGRTLSIETGRLARQAGGATLVQYGDTVILATATISKHESPRDFLPLFCEYREKFYAAGKIPGGFFKREGRPQTKEVLSSRLIDRPIRPLLPSHMRNEIQLYVNVLSADTQNDPDILALIGASAALSISTAPFDGPTAAVRIGLVDGEYLVNPTFEALEESRLNLVIAGTDEAVVMVEGSALEISNEEMQRALEIGHAELRKAIALQNELLSKLEIKKIEIPAPDLPDGLAERIRNDYGARVVEAVHIQERLPRGEALDAIKEEARAALDEAYPEQRGAIGDTLHDLEKVEIRRRVLEDGTRVDGRGMDDVRSIVCETSVLPRTHGSAVFTRGETQALAVMTLGSTRDEQKIDALEGESWRSFMLHYNFPSFSVGEVRPIRGPGRREIGHGNLAERALMPIIPLDEVFPYTIRLVSDVLESNGSSSMATVCASSLALMDGGAPTKAPVAGVAMGLIKEGDSYAVLTDILGLEDHLGDMDFKVAGTREGITAFQLDSKIGAIPPELLIEALGKAKTARVHILDIMDQELPAPRPQLSDYAPRIVMVTVPPEKIGEIIGPGGRVIRKMQEETETKIDINDEGIVKISGDSADGVQAARETIELMMKEPKVGEEYEGPVKSITDFGAFIEILPNRDGLCHISELEYHRVNSVEDVVKMGEMVKVKVIGVEDHGKVRLSRKALMPKPEGYVEPPKRERPARSGGRSSGGRSSGGRGGGRGRR